MTMPLIIPITPQYSAGLLCSAIVMCFSFCFLIMTIWYRSPKMPLQMLGYSFFSAFLFNFIFLFANNYELSYVFSYLTEPILFLLIMISLAAKHDKNNPGSFFFIMISIPSAAVLTVLYSNTVRSILINHPVLPYASLVIALAILFRLRKEKGDMLYLFWSVIVLFVSVIAQYYLPPSGYVLWVAPFLKLGAYILLLVFFYHVLLKAQLDKSRDAEKQLSALNRTIETEVKKRMLEIEKVNKKLLDISKIDSMSQVMNKMAILDSIETLIRKNPKSEFSIMMFDIDNFKSINDTHGHIVGDKCIKLLSAIGRNNIRDFDMIGRYGGDEFIIALPDVGTDHAVLIAERFRRRVDASDSPHFTISIGIATYPCDGTDVKALIEAADSGLYKSKSKGRNTASHHTFY